LGVGFQDFDHVHEVVEVSVLEASVQLATWKYCVGAGGVDMGFVGGCILPFFFLLLFVEM
jgi:hypothetical protein